jgi:GNAT superfamily N-acetyltransferase
MRSEVVRISERFKKARIGLKDILAMIDVTLDDHRAEFHSSFPYEVFEGLDESIDKTVHGTRIERFKPKGSSQHFHAFEIHTEEGEVLGYLNMIFIKRPIPCYYLVYVEVLPPFRGRGLGNKILKAFSEFADERGVVGLLDNIIPPNEPTYDIYTKLGWKCVEELLGDSMANGCGNYMVFIPTPMKTIDLRSKLIKLLFKVNKKRPIIDMHDNESMVRRTIEEFRSVYETLDHLFDIEISTETSTPFMHFIYTKFITKLLGFRRRITTLLGYTGGESLEQIGISEKIKNLPILPYSLWWVGGEKTDILGEEEIIGSLPEELKKEPTLFIEGLPLYRRPYLISWMAKKGGQSLNLKISDLLELGFDPTKLREFHHEGADYIFERVSPGFLPSLEKKMNFLLKIGEAFSERQFHNATLRVNPPLAIIQDRGNLYILRKKVDGIHSEEALDQLRTSPSLKTMNKEVGIDRTIVVTINEINKGLMKGFGSNHQNEIENLAFFIPWDLERNIPKVRVNITGISFDTVWIA